MTNPIFSNQQKKIKIIKTTAIWCSKHHSTYLSSSYRFYVALLPARKTTITLLPKMDLLCNIDWLGRMETTYYNRSSVSPFSFFLSLMVEASEVSMIKIFETMICESVVIIWKNKMKSHIKCEFATFLIMINKRTTLNL